MAKKKKKQGSPMKVVGTRNGYRREMQKHKSDMLKLNDAYAASEIIKAIRKGGKL